MASPSPKLRKPLSKREWEVLRLSVDADTSLNIASQMGVSERTVCWHLVSIYAKLGVGSRHRAIVQAVRMGLLKL